ncbi:uncharacterized protein LOC135083043 [Ostrinia nubilalis]|uniref:uncharacterized protein LOC135083043 n=1 Tax=Ostrinia nubilalis TaxID=29057 RepID=UPI0030822D68
MKNTFHDYQIELYSFDAEIFVDSYSYNVEYKIIVWFAMLVMYRCGSFATFYALSLDFIQFPLYNQVLYYLVLLASDIVLLVYAYVFSYAYERMKSFTLFVKKDDVDIVSCHYLYKNLAEMVEKVKKSFDLVLILTLLANTTDAILHVYYPFADKAPLPNTLKETFYAIVAYAVVAQQLLILFFPAFTAGLLADQVEKLRLALYDRLIKDNSNAKDLKRFVGYVDGRPLRFRVWCVVPLDWRLPVIVINISITYIIVMIQFMRK